MAASFIRECQNYDEDFYIVLSKRLQDSIDTSKFASNFHFFYSPFRPGSEVTSLRDQARFLKDVEIRVNPDVVFTTSGPAYWRPKASHLIGFNLAHHIYPESIFFKQQGRVLRLMWSIKRGLFKYYFSRDGDSFVVQTNDVRSRLAKWLGTDKDIHVVSNTYGCHFALPTIYPSKLPMRVPGEFRLLMLSAFYAHKNFSLIKEIIGLLKSTLDDRIKFILTLPDQTYMTKFTPYEREYCYNVGVVDMEECPSLYMECDAVFVPTLLECFSANYPEAMIMRRPILTSDLDFAHVICDDAALYFDPVDPQSALTQILRIVQDEILREGLIKKGIERVKCFDTSETRARKYIKICTDLANSSKN